MKLIYQKSSRSWYAILSAVLLTGFLLILTAWTFHIVLQELYDGRGQQNYLKAYAAAEAGLEEALYLVNEYDYWYHEIRSWDTSILGDNPKIPEVAFDFESKSKAFTWSLESFDMDIIPLFWRDSDGMYHNIIWDLELVDETDSFAWNIVWLDVGVWWSGAFISSTKQVPRRILNTTTSQLQQFNIETVVLNEFLMQDEMRFMIIINNSDNTQQYTLLSWGEYLTLPRHDIVSSGRIGRFTQNIRTELDNTEYLGLLRYSIFWWN